MSREVNFSRVPYSYLSIIILPFVSYFSELLKKNRGLLFLHGTGRRSIYCIPFFSFLITNTHYTCTVLYKYLYLYMTDGSEIYFSFFQYCLFVRIIFTHHHSNQIITTNNSLIIPLCATKAGRRLG